MAILIVLGAAVAYYLLTRAHDNAVAAERPAESVPDLAAQTGRGCVVSLLYAVLVVGLFMGAAALTVASVAVP